MNKSPLRSEISIQDKWKIEDLYRDDSLWMKDYEKVSSGVIKECCYKGRLDESVDYLYQALKESDELDLCMERLYVYAFMKYYEDTTNPVYQEMSGKAQVLMSKLNEKYSFLRPEIIKLDDETIEYFLKDPRMGLYKHMIEDILAKKKYSLSEKEEKLLAKAAQVTSSPNEIFSKFNNADVKFGDVKAEDGSDIELTNGRYSVLMQSHNREVRKNAFEALYKQYETYINTLAAVYYANVKQAIFYAQARNYDSTLQMYLSGSFIPISVYKNLCATVNNNMDLMYRYVRIRKNALKVPKLHFYDLYAPMVTDYTWKVPYEEAKAIAVKALAPLGSDYIEVLENGLNAGGWVDVRENAGKRSGAFSWGAYGTHPYVFLNYSDTLNDVFTLVHEMGHAMHTYYSNETQPYIYAGYRIFVAEVASTCNEALLMNYLLDNCKDNNQYRYLLNHYMEQFKATLYRQTMFAEFEMKAHEMAEAGEILNAKNLCNIYIDLNRRYFGSDIEIDDEIAYEWARIPHFYTPFYVYQYATSYAAAIAISSRIINKEPGITDKYRKFLSSGSSKHPIELLKICDIDMENPAVIQDALNVFKGILDKWDKMDKTGN